MQEFVVLGQVPGTDIQISFAAWVYVSSMVLAVLCIVLARHRIAAHWQTYLVRVRTKKIAHLLTVYRLP